MEKERLDVLLVEKKLVDTRSLAQRLIMAGQIRVNGEVVLKASERVNVSGNITIDHGPQFVSRGGEKLIAALSAFQIKTLHDENCADIGASTGGFTDCLLQYGAKKVYAIDVGHGELHWKLRNNPKVIVMERTNARFLDHLPEKVSFITIDASFISLKILLPVAQRWLIKNGRILALVKPQFEAGKIETAHGKGVIRDTEIHKRVVKEILEYALKVGLEPKDIITSPILGPKGNKEFLILFNNQAEPKDINLSANSDFENLLQRI